MSGDTSTTSKVFSAEELAKLNTKESLHLVVSGKGKFLRIGVERALTD